MAPDVGIFLIWIAACVFLQVGHVNGDPLLPEALQYSSFKSADTCIFPFTYGGQKHFDCTRHGSLYHWCAVTEEYTGKWKYCTKDDFAQCYFPFIYNGKPYDSCTTDGSFLKRFWCSVTSNYDDDNGWKYCY